MATTVSQVILCTGANRSLGFSIIQALGTRVPGASYLLGCRTQSAGQEAAQQLRGLGITAPIEVVQLDVTSDTSIQAAVSHITNKYGKLDVLINNAGIAVRPDASDLASIRSSWTTTLSTNLTSIAVLSTAMLPLLHASPRPKVINVSSARGSFERSITGKLPPTLVVSYGVSKTALNALTVEMQKGEEAREGDEKGRVKFYVVNPGHLKTAFNGFKGARDPLDGAEVVVGLVEGEEEGGIFWEWEDGGLRVVPW